MVKLNKLYDSRYINVGCGAMKLILKNFASVIKSNIDSPVQTVGVDISREER
jgi:katanin p80 WD40 repeat-containing subunit B1